MNHPRRVALGAGLAALLSVAGCTSGGADGSPASSSAVATVTTTAPPTTSAPPTATGAPVTGTPTAPGESTGSGGAGGSGGSGTGGSGPVLCTPTVMTLRIGPSSGAAGTQYFTVIATNASSSDCATIGYPGVALLDGAGNQYAQAARDTSTPITRFVVAPGQQIAAVVGEVDVPAGGVGQCPTSTGILFTLPDNTDSTTLQHSGTACSATVQPFVRYTGS